MIWIVGGLMLYLGAGGFFILSICKIGAEADEHAEKMHRLLEESSDAGSVVF
jgi:hypothetical protein